jgi:acetylglutamate kinase
MGVSELVPLQDAFHKTDVLLEAMAWMQRFRNRLVVIKLGGSALEDASHVRAILEDAVFMENVRMRPIIVHGGGKSINAAMKSAGLEPKWVQGRRYTDAATLDIVSRVLAGEIATELVRQINEMGGRAVGLSYLTRNALVGEKLMLPSPDGPLDLGFVGTIVDINRELILDTCASGAIPVIPSVAVDEQGQRYNVNADTVAAAIATRLDAEKLIFISDIPGILLDRDKPHTRQSRLTVAECRNLIATGVISAGMVPKVEGALDALEAGVKKVHIVDGRLPHSMLCEIYSNEGVGTEIVP